VNVPISTTRFAPVRRASIVSSAPCSGATCMIEIGPSAWVSLASESSTGSGGVPCATR
jgi:hypothetical protein